MTIPIKSVTFWINAFLPWALPGTTTVLQVGPCRGYSAIAGPKKYCLTDQRGFSNVITAESRMHSAVTIDFGDSTPVMSQQHTCDYTTEGDRKAGIITARKKASSAQMQFRLVAAEPIVTQELEQLTQPSRPAELDSLTPRELDVLRLVAQGMTDAQVAEKLVVSIRTVSSHLYSVYNKLGVNSRTAATRYAMEHKLV